jgi:hypothetical protein
VETTSSLGFIDIGSAAVKWVLAVLGESERGWRERKRGRTGVPPAQVLRYFIRISFRVILSCPIVARKK